MCKEIREDDVFELQKNYCANHYYQSSQPRSNKNPNKIVGKVEIERVKIQHKSINIGSVIKQSGVMLANVIVYSA